MKTVNLPKITAESADAEREDTRLFSDVPPPPPYAAIELETLVTYEGFVFRVTFRDTSIAAAAEVLRKRGCEPASAAPAPPPPATNGHARLGEPLSEPPTCPTHNRKMKPMKFADKLGNTFMCTAKVSDGWCEERA